MIRAEGRPDIPAEQPHPDLVPVLTLHPPTPSVFFALRTICPSVDLDALPVEFGFGGERQRAKSCEHFVERAGDRAQHGRKRNTWARISTGIYTEIGDLRTDADGYSLLQTV
jgi:hypothetical protein